MSIRNVIETPVQCEGVPNLEGVTMVELNEEFVINKAYKCFGGHSFILEFDSPINIPVMWECPECSVVAAEA